MKKNLLLTMALLVSGGFAFSQVGEPDEYGYTWKDNTADGGPTQEWIDITGIGTEVTGLGDDNVVGPFDIGFEFQYYWTKPKQFYVGSNGYISFDRQVQISSGQSPHFPNIPTADFSGNHNFLAPLLGDLNFGGLLNPGKVYYWTNATDSLVVSFIDAPFWHDEATEPTQYAGANTFQIVMTAADSSIQFNYLKQEGTPNASYDPAQNAVVAGIENINGRIGQEIFDVLPVPPISYKFYYPDSVTFQVIDVQPSWNHNAKNHGFFAIKGQPMPVQTMLSNVGNTKVDAGFDIEILINESAGGTPNGPLQYRSTLRIAGLDVEENRLLTQGQPFTPEKVGPLHFTSFTDLDADLNGDNDEIETEIVVIDTVGKTSVTLSYVDDTPEGGFGFEGAGIVVTPPFYPVGIDSVEIALALTDNTAPGNNVQVRIYDDNGPNGSPGDILYDTLISKDTLVATNSAENPGFQMVVLDSSITIEDGSYYLSAVIISGEDPENTQIMTDLTGPFALNSFEVIGGVFGPYRSANTADIWMRSYVTIPPATTPELTADFGASALAGCTETDINFFSYNQDTTATLTWSFPGGSIETSSDANPTVQWATEGEYEVKLVVATATDTDSATANIIIDIAPTADFMPSADTVTLGTPVAFTNLSVGNKLNAWDFRDANNRSFEENPVYTFSTTRKFNVKLEVSNACANATVQKPVVVQRATGVNNVLSSDLTVYPNPVNNVLNIETKGQNIQTVEIYNMIGSLVNVINVTEATSVVTVKADELAEGSYFVKVKADDQIGTTKFTVVK